MSDLRMIKSWCQVRRMVLQRLMDRLNETANRFNMKINVPKTKTMVVSRDEGQVDNITIGGQRAAQVKNFKYLGANISEDGYNLVDMKIRIALAKEVFNKRKEFLTKGELGRILKREWYRYWCGQ